MASSVSSTDFLKELNKNNYKYLVFSGGGIKGISYVGALKEFLNKNKIDGFMGFKGFAGTSAGSIIATLLALGLDMDEIELEMNNLDVSKIPDDKFGVVRDTISLFSKYGICKNDYLYRYLGRIIEEKTGSKDFTIKQLYEKNKIKLVIATTDCNSGKTIYLNPFNSNPLFSDIPIRLAVKMSTSIPFLFRPVSYANTMFVDGGLLDNYPISVFDHKSILTSNQNIDVKLGKLGINKKVLGFKIISKNNDNEKNIDGFFNYSVNFISVFLNENEQQYMSNSNKARTILIKTQNYSLMDFSMDEERKKTLIESGIKAVDKFYKN
jgi:NTE family protein